MENLDIHVNNRSKHYRCVIAWCKRWGKEKRRKPTLSGTPFDLCDLLGEGATVAHEIWRRFENRATETAELAATGSQHTQAKMPSYDEVVNSIEASRVEGFKLSNDHYSGMRLCYDYIARHFGCA